MAEPSQSGGRVARTPTNGNNEPVVDSTDQAAPVDALTDEQRSAHGEFLQRHSATLGRPMSDVERERIMAQGPEAVGFGPQERDLSVPQTVNGPLDHADPSMADKDLWKRQEKAHIERNNSEVERASKAAQTAGYGELIAVRSGLTGSDADRVAFSEIDPIHPHGYAYVAGKDSPPVIIAPTPAVQEALLFHRLVKVDGPTPVALRERERTAQAQSSQGEQQRTVRA
jgi:hypothetical protein